MVKINSKDTKGTLVLADKLLVLDSEDLLNGNPKIKNTTLTSLGDLIGGSGTGNIAYIDTTLTADDPDNHQYKYFRTAVETEPVDTIFYLVDGQSDSSGGTGTLTFKNGQKFYVVNMITGFTLNLEDSVASGLRPIEMSGLFFKITDNITNLSISIKDSGIYFLLNDSDVYSIDNIELTTTGINYIYAGLDFEISGPYSKPTQYISDFNLVSIDSDLNIIGIYADEISLDLTNTKMRNVAYGMICSFMNIFTDETSVISGSNDSNGLFPIIMAEWMGTPVERESFIHFGQKDDMDIGEHLKGSINIGIVANFSTPSTNFTSLLQLIGHSDSGSGYVSYVGTNANINIYVSEASFNYYIDESFISSYLNASGVIKYLNINQMYGSTINFNCITDEDSLFKDTSLFYINSIESTINSGEIPKFILNRNNTTISPFEVWAGDDNVNILEIEDGGLDIFMGSIKGNTVSGNTTEATITAVYSSGGWANIIDILNLKTNDYCDMDITNCTASIIYIGLSEDTEPTNCKHVLSGDANTINFIPYCACRYTPLYIEGSDNTLNNPKGSTSITIFKLNLKVNGNNNVINNGILYDVDVDGDNNIFNGNIITHDLTISSNADATKGSTNSVGGTLTNNGTNTLFPAAVNAGGI